MSLTITLDTESLTRALNSLGDDINAAVRPAAQAGAQVLYEQVRANVRQLRTYTGNLERSIYQAYSPDNSGPEKATYHISWRTRGVKGAPDVAPHGINVEYGHWLRYRYYKGPDGVPHIMVRPERKGDPKPKKRASRAVLDAYYVLLPTPIRVPARSFIRNASSAFPRAYEAMEKELIKRLAEQRK